MARTETAPASLETTRSGDGRVQRLPSLTGLRFIAALLVFVFHSMYEAPFADRSAQHAYALVAGQGGWAGVGFFFVLSGFVLTWSAREDDTVRRFWRRRVFKIVPNYLLTYAAAAILIVTAGASLGGWKVLPGIFMLQSWFPQLDVEASGNPVAWSMSCEALFYLSFPLLLLLVKRIRSNRLWLWALGICAVIGCVPLVSELLPTQPALFFAPASSWQYWFIYIFPPTRMLDFVLGILMARIVLSGKWIRLGFLPAAMLAVGAYVAAYHLVPWTYSLVAVTVLPMALLIAAGAAADVNGSWSPLRNRVAIWLGNVSFAFYLWHRLVIRYGHHAIGSTRSWSTPEAIGMILAALAIALTLAGLTYAFVERPIMRRWSRR